MEFIHSNKKYIERTMYLINPYINTPAIPALSMEAFVAPANFDPDAQELNIVNAFAAYPDVNKKYIFSVGTSATTVLPAVTGRSYAYSQNGGAYTTIASGTITWTVGSTKRNVVVIDSASTIEAAIPNGGVWVYTSSKVYSISSRGNIYIKYIHCQDSNSLTNILGSSFFGCSGLTGILTIASGLITLYNGETYPTFYGCNFSEIISNNSKYIVYDNVLYEVISPENYITFTSVKQYAGPLTLHPNTTKIFNNTFESSKRTGSLVIPAFVTQIGSYAFYKCVGFTSLIISNSVKTINNNAFFGCTGLMALAIPNSVTFIGYAAFANCYNISLINNYRSTPQDGITDSTFASIVKSTPLHVPVGSLAAYQAAPYWNAFTNIIDDL